MKYLKQIALETLLKRMFLAKDVSKVIHHQGRSQTFQKEGAARGAQG